MAPSFPVPLTLATIGYFSWSSDPCTFALASASILKVTIISPQIALPFLRYKDGIGLGHRLRARSGQLGRADNVESIWISGDGSAFDCPYDYKILFRVWKRKPDIFMQH